jgi:macrolide-specific efflux system membrane fusion protein
MSGFFKKKWVRYLLILIIGGSIIGYFLMSQGDQPEYVLAKAEKGMIVQTVSVTGSIVADPTIDLHFQKSGKVSGIHVEEGETVQKGQTLASLENIALELEIKRNKANVSYASAQYDQTKAGTKTEEIRIAEADVASAQAAYDAAESELENIKTINQANIELAELTYDQAQDNVDAAEKDLETTTALAEKEIAKLELGGSNTQTVALENAYSQARTRIGIAITAMQDSIFLAEEIIGIRGSGFFLLSENKKTNLERNYYNPADNDYQDAYAIYNALTFDATDEDYDSAIAAAVKASSSVLTLLTQIGTVLQDLPYSNTALQNYILEVSTQSSTLSPASIALNEIQATILNITTGSEQDTETLILSYQLQIDAAENAYNTALNSLDTAEFNLEQSKLNAENSDKNSEAQVAIKKAALNAANAMLNLKRSPVRSVDLAPLLAQISLASVALEIAENEFRDSQLISPIDGLVTFIHGQVGVNISLSETALKSFITIQADNLIVEANVPETDVSKISIGDKVEMTIDAFDFTEKFEGTVVSVDPAETIIQGVVYYEIKAAFDLDDDRLKSGMTTNLDIETAKKENVLTIPARAIKYEDSIRYVEVLKNRKPEKVSITTGLESDQLVEVTEGLNEGDLIITFVK